MYLQCDGGGRLSGGLGDSHFVFSYNPFQAADSDEGRVSGGMGPPGALQGSEGGYLVSPGFLACETGRGYGIYG